MDVVILVFIMTGFFFRNYERRSDYASYLEDEVTLSQDSSNQNNNNSNNNEEEGYNKRYLSSSDNHTFFPFPSGNLI